MNPQIYWLYVPFLVIKYHLSGAPLDIRYCWWHSHQVPIEISIILLDISRCSFNFPHSNCSGCVSKVVISYVVSYPMSNMSGWWCQPPEEIVIWNQHPISMVHTAMLSSLGLTSICARVKALYMICGHASYIENPTTKVRAYESLKKMMTVLPQLSIQSS